MFFFFLSVPSPEAAPRLLLRLRHRMLLLRLRRWRRRRRRCCCCRCCSRCCRLRFRRRRSSSAGRRRHRRKRRQSPQEEGPHGVELRGGDVGQLDRHGPRELADAVAELAVAGRADRLEEACDLVFEFFSPIFFSKVSFSLSRCLSSLLSLSPSLSLSCSLFLSPTNNPLLTSSYSLVSNSPRHLVSSSLPTSRNPSGSGSNLDPLALSASSAAASAEGLSHSGGSKRQRFMEWRARASHRGTSTGRFGEKGPKEP